MSGNSEEKVYEMLWDCKYCGTKKLLGLTHRFCPNCGAAQDANARYYPENDADLVAVQDHEFVGADKKCGSCGTPLKANVTFCTQCGASMEGEKAVGTKADQVIGSDGQTLPAEGSQPAGSSSVPVGGASVSGTADVSGKPKKSWKWPIIGGVVGIAVIGILAGLFIKKDVDAVLTGHEWVREINIEKYGPVRQSDWCDSMPFGAYSVTRSREVRSHNQVPDGEECRTVRKDQGDGTFTSRQECKTKYRSEPVYDDKCHYLIDKWAHSRTEKAGEKRKNPKRYWPADRIYRTGQCIGCERESSRKESLNLLFHSSENKDFTCDVKEELWLSAEAGSTWSVKVSVLGSIPDCGSLKPR